MTELDFLLDLLFEFKLPDEANKAIRERIKSIRQPVTQVSSGLIQEYTTGYIAPAPPQAPMQIAKTPAAAEALAHRQAAIDAAMSGKAEKGRTSPRKF